MPRIKLVVVGNGKLSLTILDSIKEFDKDESLIASIEQYSVRSDFDENTVVVHVGSLCFELQHIYVKCHQFIPQ